jgi:peptide-methionine (R)-S-oxide reductase
MPEKSASASLPLEKTDAEWRKDLTPEQYHVLRGHGTERAGTSPLLEEHRSGQFQCAACGQALFAAGTKFESGSGWPSFYDVAKSDAVKLVDDNSHGMHRVEVECANCGSHLGHLFDDAYDQPTGQRFCINSASLGFKPKTSKKS